MPDNDPFECPDLKQIADLAFQPSSRPSRDTLEDEEIAEEAELLEKMSLGKHTDPVAITIVILLLG